MGAKARLGERLWWSAVLGIATGIATFAAARLAAWAWAQARGHPPPKPVGLLTSVASRTSERAARGMGF